MRELLRDDRCHFLRQLRKDSEVDYGNSRCRMSTFFSAMCAFHLELRERRNDDEGGGNGVERADCKGHDGASNSCAVAVT